MPFYVLTHSPTDDLVAYYMHMHMHVHMCMHMHVHVHVCGL